MSGKLTIKSVDLVNFMCHKHLFIEFTKPFTCIGGRNGAGKSAIMIAIGIVLGQRAATLERGNNYKGLIKTGENQCNITIALNNHKKFKKSFFGQTIIVERRLRDKSSSLSIMNENRKVWSTRRDDLMYILDIYSLMLDNPLNFLTQEQSRKFLNISKPELLYDFFMRGTEIADVQGLNRTAQENISNMTSKLEKLTDEVNEMKNKLEVEENRLDMLNGVKRMEDQVRFLEKEKKWATLNKKKKELDSMKEKLNSKENEVYALDLNIAECTKKIDELRMKSRRDVEEQREKKDKNENRITEINKQVYNLEIANRELSNDLSEVKKTLEFKEKQAENLRKRFELAEDRRPDLEKAISVLRSEVSDNSSQLIELNDELKRYSEFSKDEEIKLKEYETKVYQLNKHIEYYSANDGSAYFHKNIKLILEEIKNVKFQDRVIGPIGHYIKLKELKWFKVASIVLGNTVRYFICYNIEDKALLLRIFKRNHANFPVIIPSSKSCNIKYRENNNYKTLKNVLECTDQQILTQLIILNSVEQIILVEDRQEAYKIMRNKPANVEVAYTKFGDKIACQGGSLSDFVSRKLDRFYFECSKDKLEKCKEELRKLKRPELVHKIKIKEVEQEIYRINKDIEVASNRMYELKCDYENINDLFNAKLELLNKESVYEEIANLNNQIRLLERKHLEKSNTVTKLKKEAEELRGMVYTDKSQKTMIEINSLITKKNSACVMAENIAKEIAELKNIIWPLSNEFEIESNELRKSGEIDTERKENEIQKELYVLMGQIESSKNLGDEEEIKKQVKKYVDVLRHKNDLIMGYRDNISTLNYSIELRIKKRNMFMNEISFKATEIFSALTKGRGYDGLLEFDHEEKKLVVKMRVHGYNEAGSKNTLSGGERSFAGVCLLLSLWPSLSSPVKVLDEFDVFMDSLNRKYIIGVFLEQFSSSNLQVILITPLNTDELLGDYCDIKVLDSPRQNDEILRSL